MQHRTSLAHLAKFLETQHQVTHLSMLEAVHLRAWLVFLAKEPSSRGKARTTRTCRWYAQSMHAFCNWLYGEEYIDENPAERVELPKLEKPMIRIIEYDEFEKLLSACAAPQEQGLIADRNAARNRAILLSPDRTLPFLVLLAPRQSLFTCSTSNVAFRPVVPQVTSKCVLSY